MADLPNRAATVDVEQIVTRLRGVTSARVVTDDRGAITEIHVVADESRHPKQLSRDIESALLAELGLRIDHRIVSIAQMRGGREAAAPDVRLKFVGIDYSLDRTTARARVTVASGDDTFSGVASSTIGPDLDQEQLVARATLEAVEEFLRASGAGNGAPVFELRGFTKLTGAPGQQVVIATVRMLGGRRDEDLLGSTLVRDDPWRAAASAVLDALNRRLPSLCS